MNTTQLESSVHADVDIDLANHEQEKQGPPTISQLDDVLPESYERTYIPDGELQVPVRVTPQPRNQRRPFQTAIAVVAPAGNHHFPAPVAPSRRTVSAPTRGAANAANAGRRAIKRKASLAALPPKRGIKQSPDGEHPRLSGRTAHNTRSKALLTKDVEESISSPLTIRIPARKGVEKQRDIPDNVKENPSVVEVSSAKQTNKRTHKMSTRSSDKVEAAEVPASGRLKRKELHEGNKRANPKGTDKRAKKNDEVPVEDRPKITLRIPKRPAPVVDVETVARAEREEIVYAVDVPKLRRGSRQRVPIWRICP
ncbi:hypothetical protein EYR36_009926 [Pleurotus pulmonarius]|nr:hypothetical protein EYR36_009926 [Pleurotus pulmonarius]KAF4593404.1 hypothetical protein EYR38_009118 [Pleurotus pulmonarius]